MSQEPAHYKIIRQNWAKPEPGKVNQLKTFLLTWAKTQRVSSPSTSVEDIAQALELAAKEIRANQDS